ncbi:MAG: FAD-binding oxidoreductase [Candidatus Calescibacterium sp.]|nr:FAD-binding oxidoreductase [Candidatus Calescibacterium sp.]MDW8086696.1 FAD-binding oxidoreductase [Candidatus Calescibacterium sp.]
MIGVEFHNSDDALEVYSEDASRWYKVKPKGVFFPKNTEEVLKVVRFCYQRGISLTPRGGGSGLTGGAVPSKDGFVISLEKMRNFRFEDGLVFSESGVISGQIERKINLLGYTLPAQPSSLNFSTIGGNVATNSAGLRSIKYGSIKDYVVETEVVLPTGELENFKEMDSAIFVGSEGILGIITRVVLKVVKKKKRFSYTIFVNSEKDIFEIFDTLKIFNPSAFEVLDDLASYVAFGIKRFSVIAEFEEDYKGIFEDVSKKVDLMVKGMGLQVLEIQDVWERRKRLGPALSKMKPFKINEDIVIPISSFVEYFDFVRDLRDKIDCIVFGHFGVGILHTNIMFGGGEQKTAFDVKEKIFDFVINSGGSITGEHGTGIDKLRFIEKELGEDSTDFILSLKKKMDPKNILNPGKIPLRSGGCIDTIPRFQKVLN